MEIKINPKKISMIMTLIIFILLFGHIAGLISKFRFDYDYVFGLVNLFDFDREKNLPSFYSGISLVFVSILLCIISAQKNSHKSGRRYWIVLSIIFMFLAFDELASVHEQLIKIFQERLNTSGILYYAWVIPYGTALLFFVIAYTGFLYRLPRKTAILFIISGAVFVSGALGMELIGGRHAELYGTEDLAYAAYITFEELLEMFGIVMFVYTLLSYMGESAESLTLSIDKQNLTSVDGPPIEPDRLT